jgi:hypothetical protein
MFANRDEAADFTFSADASGIVDALHRHGVALVRAALPADGIAFLRGFMTEWFRCRMDDLVSRRLTDAEFDHLLSNGLSGASVQDYNPYLMEMLGDSAFYNHARSYFGNPDVVIPTPHLLFRVRNSRVDEAMKKGGECHGFHQDHDLIPGAFPLNAWIPLTTVDENCSGLSFVFPYSTEVHKLPFDLDGYLKANSGFVWTPALAPGDMLLFHRHTIHGSFFTTGLPDTRISVELRAGSRSNSPPEYAQAIWPLQRPLSSAETPARVARRRWFRRS